MNVCRFIHTSNTQSILSLLPCFLLPSHDYTYMRRKSAVCQSAFLQEDRLRCCHVWVVCSSPGKHVHEITPRTGADLSAPCRPVDGEILRKTLNVCINTESLSSCLCPDQDFSLLCFRVSSGSVKPATWRLTSTGSTD